MEKTRILGGYEIFVEDGNILRVEKEDKQVKFAFKFYQKHKEELDIYKNIAGWVKEEQNRDEQERVSVNLNNRKTNTTDSKKLSLASLILLTKINGEVDFEVAKAIIVNAKAIVLSHDKELSDLRKQKAKLESLAKEIGEIFGTDSDNYQDTQKKVAEEEENIKAREEFLLKNI
ncbi:MAG TPA: hypothetical protein PK557_02645 [Paludibacteraceae bacterium]|nr:hypothetical protein [Paludibacteraceae bacterium]